MRLDAKSMFSDAQAITATAAATNVIDLGTARNIGVGTPVEVLVQVVTTFATLTSLTVALVGDTATPIDGSSIVLDDSGAIAAASLVAGYKFNLRYWPTPASPGYRYIGIYYTVGGSNATAGAITAGITAGHEDIYAYPAASFSG